MTISRIWYQSAKFIKHHGTTILSCIGAVGVVATTVTAVKATPKVISLLKAAKKEKGSNLTKFEMVIVATPAYIPAVLVGASTIACIFGANVLNKRQQATIVGAYVMLDNSYKEYQRKVAELFGEDGERSVHTKIAESHLKDVELGTAVNNELLFYEEYSDRYFNMTMAEFSTAIYHLNRNFILKECVTLNDLYEFLDLSKTDLGYTLGWSALAGCDTYGYNWIDFKLDKVVLEDNLECHIVTMPFAPTIDYDEY